MQGFQHTRPIPVVGLLVALVLLPLPGVVLANGARATVSVAYYKGSTPILHKDPGLHRMFDGNPDTYWTADSQGCKNIGFFVTLKKPAYVKKVEVHFRGKAVPTEGDLTIEQSTDEDAAEVWTHRQKLSPGNVKEISAQPNYYLGVLKAKVLIIGFSNCSVKGGSLAISDMDVKLSRTPTLVPVMTAKEVEKAVESLNPPEERKKNGWHFPDDENDPNKAKYLAHLMYYGLLGDRRALDLFNDYNPRDADAGEDYSAIASWDDADRK